MWDLKRIKMVKLSLGLDIMKIILYIFIISMTWTSKTRGKKEGKKCGI